MYSSKYVVRLPLGLLLISVGVFDRVESGNVIGQNLPDPLSVIEECREMLLTIGQNHFKLDGFDISVLQFVPLPIHFLREGGHRPSSYVQSEAAVARNAVKIFSEGLI